MRKIAIEIYEKVGRIDVKKKWRKESRKREMRKRRENKNKENIISKRK